MEVIIIKEFRLTCGEIVLLDDEDYERLDKIGWYLTPLNRQENGYLNDRKTRYVTHDTYGRMHRWVLGITNPKILIDHIDHNGLNNQKSNLRLVTSSQNKKNQAPVKNNKFNFNGVSLEKSKSPRIRVRWSSGEIEYKYKGYRAKQYSKSFSIKKYNYDYNKVLKDAILFRINKMKENDYLLDERSTTIEKVLLENENPDMEEILGISFKEIFE